ncbi:hypothetical protein AMTRI_Chr05g59590 [Amborella trichopoda]
MDIWGGQDLISWYTMMHGHTHHGHGREAYHLWDAMKRHGVIPNYAIFVWHIAMFHEHGMLPCMEHDACIVNRYGGAGMLDKVKRFMYSGPSRGKLLGKMKIKNGFIGP